MSGIEATPEAVEFYNKFKLQRNRKGEKYRYVIYRITDNDTKITVDEMGNWDATWEDFVDSLADAKDDKGKGKGAYAIFDFDSETTDGRIQEKLVFVAFTPDTLPVKQKMLYGSTRESFKSELGSGLALVVQASSLDDLEKEKIEKSFR